MKRTKYIAAALCIALFFSGCAKEQDQKKHIFGATYMTRNNPYFDVLNDEIAEGVEANGDKLIVRDRASGPVQTKSADSRYDR